jgi:drug/metabolite transporter (DMT)-like permease
MVTGLLAACLCALCYGVASVLQAIAAHRTPSSADVDPRLLVRVVRQGVFLAGLGLDTVGFAAQFWALRTLPVFLVQAALAASLAVTAVAAIPLLGLRLDGRQWTAVAVVCVGLAALGGSAGAEHPRPVSLAFRWGLIGCTALLGMLGLAANRLRGRARGLGLGVVGGLSFGVVAVAARALTNFSLIGLLRDPAAYAVPLAGGVAFLYYTIGLQQTAVTTVTAALIIGETVLPAVVGVIVFGDETRAGLVPLAIVGFSASIAGSLALAQFGDLAAPAAQPD